MTGLRLRRVRFRRCLARDPLLGPDIALRRSQSAQTVRVRLSLLVTEMQPSPLVLVEVRFSFHDSPDSTPSCLCSSRGAAATVQGAPPFAGPLLSSPVPSRAPLVASIKRLRAAVVRMLRVATPFQIYVHILTAKLRAQAA